MLNVNSKSAYSFRKIQYQIITVICVNIISFSCGNTIGWLSPSIINFKSDNTPLIAPLTIYEISWLGSFLNIGSIFGLMIYTSIIQKFGPKTSILLMAIPTIISAILIEYGSNVYYLYVSRFLAGVLSGGVFICIPLFVADIADENIRGTLGTFMSVSLNFGILTLYIAGSYMSYQAIPFLILVFPLIFLFGLLFVPDTPQYLLSKGKTEAAKKSLRFYKNCHKTIDEERLNTEYNKIVVLEEEKKKMVKKLFFKDFCTPQARRGLLIAIYISVLTVCNGTYVIIYYASEIFMESGAEIDPNLSSIILIIVQLIATFCATVLIDNVGRRLLVIVSTTGSALGLAVVGVYSFLFSHAFELTNFNWIPVTSLSLVLFSNSVGVNSVNSILIAEVFPTKIRATGLFMSFSFVAYLSFTANTLFPIISHIFGMYVFFWTLALVCVSGILFSVFCITETKRKDLNIYSK